MSAPRNSDSIDDSKVVGVEGVQEVDGGPLILSLTSFRIVKEAHDLPHAEPTSRTKFPRTRLGKQRRDLGAFRSTSTSSTSEVLPEFSAAVAEFSTASGVIHEFSPKAAHNFSVVEFSTASAVVPESFHEAVPNLSESLEFVEDEESDSVCLRSSSVQSSSRSSLEHRPLGSSGLQDQSSEFEAGERTRSVSPAGSHSELVHVDDASRVGSLWMTTPLWTSISKEDQPSYLAMWKKLAVQLATIRNLVATALIQSCQLYKFSRRSSDPGVLRKLARILYQAVFSNLQQRNILDPDARSDDEIIKWYRALAQEMQLLIQFWVSSCCWSRPANVQAVLPFAGMVCR